MSFYHISQKEDFFVGLFRNTKEVKVENLLDKKDELKDCVDEIFELSSDMFLSEAIYEAIRGKTCDMENNPIPSRRLEKIKNIRDFYWENANSNQHFRPYFLASGEHYFECALNEQFNSDNVKGAFYFNFPKFGDRLKFFECLLRVYAFIPNAHFNFKFNTRDMANGDYRTDNFVVYVENGKLNEVCSVIAQAFKLSPELTLKLDQPARSLTSIDDNFAYQTRGSGSWTSDFCSRFCKAMDITFDNKIGNFDRVIPLKGLEKDRKQYKLFLKCLRQNLEKTLLEPEKPSKEVLALNSVIKNLKIKREKEM